jgi:hypothetical protein
LHPMRASGERMMPTLWKESKKHRGSSEPNGRMQSGNRN